MRLRLQLFALASLLGGQGVALAQMDVRDLGLTLTPLFDAAASGNRGPAVVLDVWEGTAAAAAGVERGDLVTAVDGNRVAGQDFSAAFKAASEAPPGSVVRLTLLRPGDGFRRIELDLKASATVPLRENPRFESFAYKVARSWRLESYEFPLPWAPRIAWRGIEDVLFAPGFRDRAAPAYHALVWVWWVDGHPAVDAETIAATLREYFRGLSQERGTNHGFKPQLEKVTVAIQPLAPPAGHPARAAVAAYRGEVVTYNTEGQLITLLVEVESPPCDDRAHTPLLFRLATQPRPSAIWQDLQTVTDSFRCRR
jgi:PDZ domain